MNNDWTENPGMGEGKLHVYYPVTINSSAGSAQTVVSGPVVVGGWSVTELSGTQLAVIQPNDGGPSNGQPIADINLGASQSVRENLPGHGVLCRNGLTVNFSFGSARAIFWVRGV